MLTPELKQTIIQKFLQENPCYIPTFKHQRLDLYITSKKNNEIQSLFPNQTRPTRSISPKKRFSYEDPLLNILSNALDILDGFHGGILDLTHVLTDIKKWKSLTKILSTGLEVTDDDNNDHTIDKIEKAQNHEDIVSTKYRNTKNFIGNQALILQTMESTADRLFLEALPKPDYYNREVVLNPSYRSLEIDDLIERSKQKIASLLGMDPPPSKVNLLLFIHDLETVKLKNFSKKKSSINDSETASTLNKKNLLLARDLLKLYELEALAIPLDYREENVLYYKVLESVAGVTEKIALIHADLLKQKLSNLVNSENLTIDHYYKMHASYNLRMNAMLKLPKNQKIETCQAESAALTLSELLGNNTTNFCCVCWDQRPALFIPFNETLQLMQRFATGSTYYAWNFSKTYQNHSTINPIGESLEANAFIPDFGNIFPLIYLCSDPDSMGGYNQNKGLTQKYKHGPHEFFVFDQSIQELTYFKLNSALCLHPRAWFFKHTRHGQGRNHTLIDDSSHASKYTGLMNLVKKQRVINAYFDYVDVIHTDEIESISMRLSQITYDLGNLTDLKTNEALLSSIKKHVIAMIDQKSLILLMKKNNHALKKAVQMRINRIVELFPEKKGHVDEEAQYRVLLLEKLIHYPVLFNHAGRPYQYPWTTEHSNPVLAIIRINDTYRIHFTHALSRPAKIILSQLNLSSLDVSALDSSAKEITLSLNDLDLLEEDMLYPERSMVLRSDHDYLNAAHLNMLYEAYGKSNRHSILLYVKEYKERIQSPNVLQEKIIPIESHLLTLENYIKDLPNKSFGMHVLKLIQLDYQQHLQKIIGVQKPTQLNDAFLAARKLDRTMSFNRVVARVLANNTLHKEEFHAFLNHCIKMVQNATDYESAVNASENLHTQAENFLNNNNQTTETHMDEKHENLIDPSDIKETVTTSPSRNVISHFFKSKFLQITQPLKNRCAPR